MEAPPQYTQYTSLVFDDVVFPCEEGYCRLLRLLPPVDRLDASRTCSMAPPTDFRPSVSSGRCRPCRRRRRWCDWRSCPPRRSGDIWMQAGGGREGEGELVVVEDVQDGELGPLERMVAGMAVRVVVRSRRVMHVMFLCCQSGEGASPPIARVGMNGVYFLPSRTQIEVGRPASHRNVNGSAPVVGFSSMFNNG